MKPSDMISTFTNEGFVGLANKLGEHKDRIMQGVPDQKSFTDKLVKNIGGQFAIDPDGTGKNLYKPMDGMTAEDVERHKKTL